MKFAVPERESMTPRNIVLTAALPYANGDLHIGHMLEHLLCDFWIRFQKMRGNDALFLCADDTHGTPIMIRAKSEKITPEALIARSHQQHSRDFADFEVGDLVDVYEYEEMKTSL
jgi:methionyl-tRNA synthetase